MTIEIQTGVGRLVWGHPLKSQQKKYMDGPQKGQPVVKADGSPALQWAFGVAFPEAEFERDIWPHMYAEAISGYPQGVPPRFSYKMHRAAEIDSKGVPYGQREGYAGNVVLTVSTEYAPPAVYKLVGGQYVQLKAEELKTGDYLALALNLKVNVATGTNTPSLYVNPQAVEWVAYGTEIVSQGAVDPNAVFKGRQHALPPGASATPVQTPGGAAMPGTTPPPPGAGAQSGRPTDPTHIANAGTPNEQWWNGTAWIPAPTAAPPPPPVTPPPPPASPPQPPAAQRPVDPSHIANAGTPNEHWWNGTAWTPAPVATTPPPPPAHDFVQGAGTTPPPPMPGMPAPR